MWPFTTMKRGEVSEDRSVIDFSAFSDLLTPTSAGVAVNQDNAPLLPAVFKCWSLNSEMVSSLPLDVFKNVAKGREPYPDPVWLRPPNALQTLREFVAMTQVSLDADGNAFWLKIKDDRGNLSGLTLLPPGGVSVDWLPEVGILYRASMMSGAAEVYPPSAIVHLRGMTLPGQLRGLSPISAAKQTIGIGKAAEQFGANFFGNGANLSGVIQTPTNLNKEQADLLKESFSKHHSGVSKSHAIGVLTGGATWQQMSVKPEEAQFLESRKYTANEIANLYGVPPELVTDVAGAKGYVTALSARLRLWYITGLMPRLIRIEEAFSNLLPRPAYVKFNRSALLQMDPNERVAFYAAAQTGEWMSRNEIRALEDMNPVPGGDKFLHSVQWQENAPPDAPTDSNPPDQPAASGLFDGGTQ